MKNLLLRGVILPALMVLYASAFDGASAHIATANTSTTNAIFADTTADDTAATANTATSTINNAVLINDNILNQKVVSQINLISNEIYAKTGVFLGVSISDKNDFKHLFDTTKAMLSHHDKYAIIVLDSASHRLSILNSKNMQSIINKDKLLNFYYLKWGFFPTQGAILPLISSPKAADPYNAGVLNGFGQMAEDIAKHYEISLDSGFASTNQDFLNTIRLVFYAMVLIALIVIIKRKFTRKNIEN